MSNRLLNLITYNLHNRHTINADAVWLFYIYKYIVCVSVKVCVCVFLHNCRLFFYIMFVQFHVQIIAIGKLIFIASIYVFQTGSRGEHNCSLYDLFYLVAISRSPYSLFSTLPHHTMSMILIYCSRLLFMH